MAHYDDGLGVNTYVSYAGQTEGGEDATNGASLPGSGMKTHHGVVTIMVIAAVTLVGIRVLFRNPSTK